MGERLRIDRRRVVLVLNELPHTGTKENGMMQVATGHSPVEIESERVPGTNGILHVHQTVFSKKEWNGIWDTSFSDVRMVSFPQADRVSNRRVLIVPHGSNTVWEGTVGPIV